MIALIAGTNRPRSTTRLLAEYYATRLRVHGAAAVELVDLADLPPDFTATALYGNTGRNDAFNALAAPVLAAEGLVFVVPEYNYSLPGVLKAFIDGLPYPNGLRGKTAALVGLSAGAQGGAVALSHLTDILHYLGCTVLPVQPRLAHVYQHFATGELTDARHHQLVEEQVARLVRLVG